MDFVHDCYSGEGSTRSADESSSPSITTCSNTNNRKSFTKMLMILAIGTLSLVGLSSILNSTTASSSSAMKSGKETRPHLLCPNLANLVTSANDNTDESITEFYESTNVNDILEKKRRSPLTLEEIEKLKLDSYDGWTRNFETIKESKRRWKKRMFQSLRPGESIFEAGCGLGFNLLMTAEILKEVHGIDHLEVYGIEYVQSSVEIANEILQTSLASIGSKLGSPICRGDATDLYFIGNESFDIVYTGYIDPIYDPLGIGVELGRELETDDICNKTSWAKTKLAKLDQRAQEDWYSSWVVELVRIAKKGVPIIVEEVSPPLCVATSDWGGVSRDWWSEAISRYGWDVDPDSLFIESLTPGGRRYNVFMRKNN